MVEDGHQETERDEGNTDEGYTLCAGRRASHPQYEGTMKWRDRWLENKFTRMHLDGRMRIAADKIKDICLKISQYPIKYKGKWERVVEKRNKKYEEKEIDDET
jgi:hypothetical protein